MPIKPENRELYPGGSPTSPEWIELRNRVLDREGNRCKFCRAPNHQWIARARSDPGTYQVAKGQVFNVKGEELDKGAVSAGEFDWATPRIVQVILTIMHLDHDPGNNGLDNLAAGCQRCHNIHDAPHRKRNAAETRRSRRAARDLFDPVLQQEG